MAEIGDKGLIKREMSSRRELRQGTVITIQTLKNFDVSGVAGAPGAPCWVVDVETSGNNILRDVPIKASGSGSRFYADRGQAVLMRRNADGRYQIVAPGDRKAAPASLKYYNLLTQNQSGATVNLGFTFNRQEFHYYEGDGSTFSRWNDGVTPWNVVLLVDADGNPA